MISAVVRFSGRQFCIRHESEILVNKLSGNPGDEFAFNDILVATDNGKTVDKSSIKASGLIIGHANGTKKMVFKKRRRHGYQRKCGASHPETSIKIRLISNKTTKNTQKTQ